MTYDADVLIVGGGLNGAAMAVALNQTGIRSVVIDAAPLATHQDSAFDGRSYALALGSVRMMQALNLWDDLDDHAQPMLEIKASDGRAGEGAAPFFLHFDHAELEEGPMGHMIEDRVLRQVLLRALDAGDHITHITGHRVVAQDTTGAACVTLADGRRVTARIMIGADGRHSGVAARAGIGRTDWDYGQTALVCAIEHALPHHGIAHQFFMPGGPLAILPLQGNRSSIVWSDHTQAAAHYATMSDTAFLDALRPRFGDFLGEINLIGARYAYPLRLSLTERFIAPHLALVGDAAHALHPIAGQGLNLGLQDVAALAEVLATAQRRGEDIASPLVLARYQSWRRPETLAMAAATTGVNALFSNDNTMLRLARDLGMGVITALPFARRALMRHAAGLTGAKPRLMQGRKI